MTNEDKRLIIAFAENKPMFEAVRRVLLAGMVGEDFASKNWVFALDRSQSDSAFGKDVKIAMKALEWIERGFNDLKRVGASNPQASGTNEAR